MANPEHVKILEQGVQVWNKWREVNPEVTPDLIELGLRNGNLRGINLAKAKLSLADLLGTNLTGANLSGANLCRANLTEANLTGSYIYSGQTLLYQISEGQN
ncbi:MAG: pentapeptide repeat-containing protein [Nitrospinae bacterium]|nr:pentapeptide repeat-containing protein [Nitrospinota bacterium]MBL7019746.1 pentapeptide repeat-containing protein [Nitrospinaceae bacterium]